MPLLPSARLSQWKELLRETAFYAAATALGTVYFQVAVVATSLLSTQTETGYYSVAFRVVENQMNYAYLGDRLKSSASENFPVFLADLCARAEAA